MRKALTILLLPLFSYGQLVITDDFSDGNFTSAPAWSGNDSLFKVDANQQLQLQDTMSREAYLNTPSGISFNASWEFYCRMEFNPSSSNFCKVYLLSDQPDFSGPLNGYYVRMGGSSSDRVSLYRQTGNTSSLIVETTDDWLNSNTAEARVKVTRDSSGLWVLAVDTSGGTNYSPIDSAVENSHRSSAWFGVHCTYTVTRSDKFFFDNFLLSGDVFVDNQPPEISQVEVVNSTSLDLTFIEALEKSSAEDISNYVVNGNIGLPLSASVNSTDKRVVHLQFGTAFANRTLYRLIADGVEDLHGNSALDTVYFSYYRPEAGDVIINELMVDPTPIVGLPPDALPEREYIELWNRSGLPVDLADWTLIAGSSEEVLPPFTLSPDSYVVLTKDEGVNEFPAGLPLIGLDMSSVALTNSGNTVSLEAPAGDVISVVSYTDGWYGDPAKDDGGWALELIDPENRCGGMANWKASVSSAGGTPGVQNSVFGANPDTTAPQFERVAITGDSSVMVYFSETVDDSLLRETGNYRIEPSLSVSSVEPVPPEFDRAELFFATAIDPETIYQFSLVDYPQDCSNNTMHPDTLVFTIPARPEQGDILINEVLFNPPTGGSDFVEIYNNSDKIFDLAKLRLGNFDPAFMTVDDPKMISEESYLFEPGRYLALTYDAGFLLQHYVARYPANIIQTAESLPSMDDKEGSIAVVTSDLTVITDYLQYQDDMHLAVLKDDDGVSLERLSFEKPAADDDNWQSAAATAGFATPGYQNSQYSRPQPKGEIGLEPKVFSPNQDGYHDLLHIVYNFPDPNNVISISIWSPEGYEVVKLQESVSVSQQGFFSWDGMNMRGQLVNSGIYIVVVEYFNQNGNSEVIKASCVVSL